MLYERVRPTTLDRIIGQNGAITSLKHLIAPETTDPLAILIRGRSGWGKTTAALACARQLNASEDWGTTFLDSRTTDLAALREVESNMSTMPPVGRWKTYIIDEAHSMSSAAQNFLLGLLERLPDHRAIIATTTEDKPFKSDALLSRWIKITLRQPDPAEATTLIRDLIAQVNGVEASDSTICRLLKDRNFNMREAITDIVQMGARF